MDETFFSINDFLRWVFWRIAAGVTGLAVRREAFIRRSLRYLPLLFAAGVAYLLGRVFGQVILWSLSL